MTLDEVFPELDVTMRQARKYCAPTEGQTVQFLHDAGLLDGAVRSVIEHVQYRTAHDGSVVVFVNTGNPNELRGLINSAESTGWDWIETTETPENLSITEERPRVKQILAFKPNKPISVEKNLRH